MSLKMSCGVYEGWQLWFHICPFLIPMLQRRKKKSSVVVVEEIKKRDFTETKRIHL